MKRLKVALEEESNNQDADSPQYYFDIIPYAYQQTILDRLQIEREVYGSYLNLIVAAKGTGKTVVAAFDFKQFYKENPGVKVLFLAHKGIGIILSRGLRLCEGKEVLKRTFAMPLILGVI